MTNVDWDLIRAVHSEKTGVPPHVVDYIAVYDILKLCVSGKSIDSIAESLEFTSEYVMETIGKFLLLPEWEECTINLYHLYLASLRDLQQYRKIVSRISSMSEQDITSSFSACYLFYGIEQELISHDYFTNAS